MADEFEYADTDLADFRPNKSEYDKEADRLMADESREADDESKEAAHVASKIRIIIGAIATEVLAERTPYFHGVKRYDILDAFLDIFQKVERASEYFMKNGDRDDYENITRQHVRDIMTAYGPHLKIPPNFTFTYTYGNKFYFILKEIALTMESWN
jgi:hypothetical protein